jgi:hypothetical protein
MEGEKGASMKKAKTVRYPLQELRVKKQKIG